MKNNYFNIAVISGGMLLGGVFNYLYHPLMLRFMTLEDFGIFGSLMSILNLLSVIAAGITLFLNKEFSQNIKNTSKVYFIYITVLRFMIVLGIGLFFVFVCMSPLISSYLKISEWGYMVLIGGTIVLSLMDAVIVALLRSLKKYEYIGFFQAFVPFVKLVLGVGLVFLGYNIYGAIWGVILSSILGVSVSVLFIQKIFQSVSPQGNKQELIADFRKNKHNMVQFFFVSLFFAIFMNIDVILAKNIFDETTAGAYAGISVLGKFLIFLMLSTETVYYGQIMEYTRKELPKRLIINPLIVLGVVAIGAILTNLVIGEFVLGLLKAQLVEYYPIYMLTLVYYGLLAFLSFFAKILVGWKSYAGNKILGLGSVLLVSTPYILHIHSLEAFVYCFIIVGVITTVLLGGVFYREWKK